MLTYLKAQGLSDAQIQLISGHGSKKSLEIYRHLSLENFLNATESQEIQKILPQGGFILPVAQEGENFFKIERKKLDSLFRR